MPIVDDGRCASFHPSRKTEGNAENGTHQRGNQHRGDDGHGAVRYQTHRSDHSGGSQQKKIVEVARSAVVNEINLSE